MIEVIAPGPLLTVQDLGRPDARRYGVPQGGAMDAFALTAANLLAGNEANAAGLEITAGGVVLVFTAPALFALAGADLGATLDGRPLPLWTATMARAGGRLRLAGRRGAWGGRAYLAVAGGIDVAPALGSRATDLGGGFGGLGGRRLAPGDQLPLGPAPAMSDMWAAHYWPEARRPAYGPTPALRLIAGPHLACFAPGAMETLAGATWRVGAAANRMGYRLEGPRLEQAGAPSLPSLGVVPGVVQVPPDGAPILLMADAQTTGGYPVIGTVIAVDLPLAAQLLPGDTLRFAPINLASALEARRVQAAALSRGPEADEGDLLATLAGAPG